jgi:hypothetical protein
MIARAINAAIKPYSIAVAPASSRSRDLKLFIVASSNSSLQVNDDNEALTRVCVFLKGDSISLSGRISPPRMGLLSRSSLLISSPCAYAVSRPAWRGPRRESRGRQGALTCQAREVRKANVHSLSSGFVGIDEVEAVPRTLEQKILNGLLESSKSHYFFSSCRCLMRDPSEETSDADQSEAQLGNFGKCDNA